MAVIAVDDPDDPRLGVFRLNERGLASRPQRRNDDGEGLFMAEGDLVVERALRLGCKPIAVLVDETRPPPLVDEIPPDVPVYAGGEQMRALVTKLGVPSAIVAVFERPARTTVDQLALTARRIVLVEAVDNPANIGAIIRNAAGLGWEGLITDATSADPLARRSTRVSMGHAVGFPHARAADVPNALHALAERGFAVVALTPAVDALDLDHVERSERIVLCVGAERVGLSEPALAAATVRARIAMRHGVDSLNVAAATAIACYVLR
ncbi:MAG: TrmH family RNA methyltransferase [Ilumatobacteraceae bacterium]